MRGSRRHGGAAAEEGGGEEEVGSSSVTSIFGGYGRRRRRFLRMIIILLFWRMGISILKDEGGGTSRDGLMVVWGRGGVGVGARLTTHHNLLVYIDDDGHRPTDRPTDWAMDAR